MAGTERDLSAVEARPIFRTFTTDAASKLDTLLLPSWAKWVSLYFTTNVGLVSDTGDADDTISATAQVSVPADIWHTFPVSGGRVRLTSATLNTVYDVAVYETRP